MPPTRPRIPDYPRPVPQICTDELPIGKHTIIYETWTDEADAESEKRAAKRRRRIEDAAHAYLRGEPPLILSASLKGPFDGGWKNPWRKQRQISKTSKKSPVKPGFEVPETVAKKFSVDAAAVKFRDIGYNHNTNQTSRKAIEITPLLERKRLSSPFQPKDDTGNLSVAPVVGSLATSRVEDWLKTNDTYLRRQSPERQSSPTPVKHKDKNTPHAEKIVIMEPNSQSSQLQSRPTYAERQLEVNEQPDGMIQKLHSADMLPANNPTIENEKQSIHLVPPSTSQSVFKYRRVRDPARTINIENIRAKSKQQISIDTTDSTIQHDGKTGGKILRPELSTETSKHSTLHNLPSAQVPAVMPVEPQESNTVSSAKMLEELPSESHRDEDIDMQRGMVNILASDEANVEHVNHVLVQPSREIFQGVTEQVEIDVIEDVSTPVNDSSRELNTQEIIAGIEPINFSTIKKPTTSMPKRPSPTKINEDKASKRRKHASFAEKGSSTSSQGSLKTSMKVTKATNAFPAGSGSSNAIKSQAVELITNSIDEEPMIGDDNWRILSPLSPVMQTKNSSKVKGILKSSTMFSSAATPTPFHNTYSTSTKQDAQRVPGQNLDAPAPSPLEDDENFDLNAAIDDLGSFLGTWDPEKEASVLVVSSGA